MPSDLYLPLPKRCQRFGLSSGELSGDLAAAQAVRLWLRIRTGRSRGFARAEGLSPFLGRKMLKDERNPPQ